MVAMGRALMSHPKLLLMDEPSMGLAPILVERSFEIIKQVNEAGVAVLVVEQNANVSLSIADRGYVLSTGRVVLEGKAADLSRTTTSEGLPWPLRYATSVADLPRTASRSSSGSSTSTPARRARSPTRCARPTTPISTDWDEQGAPWDYWVERAETARATFARLVGGEPDEVAVTTSLSAGVSALASTFDYGQRPRVVVSDFEFPTVGQIWHAQELRGAEVVHVPPDGAEIPLERFDEAIDERTALVAITPSATATAPGCRSRRSSSSRMPAARSSCSTPTRRRARTRSTSASSASTSSARACSSTCSRRRGSVPLVPARASSSELPPTQTGWFADREHLRDGHPRLLALADRPPLRVGHAADPGDLRRDRRDRADAGDRDRRDARARDRR